MRRLMLLVVSAVAVVIGVPASVVSAAAGSRVSVVVSGLNNPRGVAFANGHLYVAEAGTGGTDCPAGVKGPAGFPLCLGRTGLVAKITNRAARPILTGLLSESEFPGGAAAEGIASVAAAPHGLQLLYGESVVGLLTSLPSGVKLAPADNVAARRQLGMLTSLVGRRQRRLADVGDSDFSWAAVHQNLVPDQFPDANPNALAVVGRVTYVIDAGSNSLEAVDTRGHVQQLAFVPSSGSSDGVPTCLAPDSGARNLYIGQLAPGASLNSGKIYRYNIASHRLSVWKTGFNVVDGCGFDRAGNFYAVEFQAHGFNPSPTGNPAGDIVKIAKSGTRTVLGTGQLFYPQGFASDGHGSIYVSNWSILTGTPRGPGAPTGQVVRLTP